MCGEEDRGPAALSSVVIAPYRGVGRRVYRSNIGLVWFGGEIYPQLIGFEMYSSVARQPERQSHTTKMDPIGRRSLELLASLSYLQMFNVPTAT